MSFIQVVRPDAADNVRLLMSPGRTNRDVGILWPDTISYADSGQAAARQLGSGRFKSGK
jgi:hypothetical protein